MFSKYHFRSHYAVGAPKGNDPKGKTVGVGLVYICHSCFTQKHDPKKDLEIKGMLSTETVKK